MAADWQDRRFKWFARSGDRAPTAVRVAALGCALSVALWTGPSALGAPQLVQLAEGELIAPEAATGSQAQQLVRAESFMVAAANPYAVQAGYDILQQGGSAVDAAIATQLVLNLVEPQSSGIGGGGFLLYFEAASGAVLSYDGRETAPNRATPALFLDDDGAPLAFFDAVVGGRSVGAPGLVALLETAYQQHGQLPWADLFAPAIELAETGFVVSPRLARLIELDQDRLRRYPATRAYFFGDNGEPLQAGDRLRNPELADTLRAIAQQGSAGFYRGAIAVDIVNTVQTVPDNPGLLSLGDLASYQAKRREPVCIPYRVYHVCGMGPPSSGGLTVGQILGILDSFDLAALGAESPLAWHLIGEASRLAFADRGVYMADSDFAEVPVAGLLNQDYLRDRAQLINPLGPALRAVAPGQPPDAENFAPGETLEQPSTTHLSIVDADGNAVSLTSSIENAFGSRVMVRGFLLNNQLTDFAFEPEVNGRPVANRVEPGKRPRSSMSPTIVLNQNGDLYLVVGSPGGSRIIGYVAQTLIAHLDWGLDIQAAITLPHRVNRFGTYTLEPGLETGAATVELADSLEALGHTVNIGDLNSGLHGIVVTPSGLEGGADPRREGQVRGD